MQIFPFPQNRNREQPAIKVVLLSLPGECLVCFAHRLLPYKLDLEFTIFFWRYDISVIVIQANEAVN
jgi:hypothetical protein